MVSSLTKSECRARAKTRWPDSNPPVRREQLVSCRSLGSLEPHVFDEPSPVLWSKFSHPRVVMKLHGLGNLRASATMDALSETPRFVSALSDTTAGAFSTAASGTNAFSETEMPASVLCNATVVATSSFRKRMQAPRSSVANCCRGRGRLPFLTATPPCCTHAHHICFALFLTAAQKGQQVCHSVHIDCSNTYISIVAELSCDLCRNTLQQNS